MTTTTTTVMVMMVMVVRVVKVMMMIGITTKMVEAKSDRLIQEKVSKGWPTALTLCDAS